MPQMLVLGDSILWGQGLDEADKISARVRDAWSRAVGAPVAVHRYAHSGADVWDDGQSGVIAAIDAAPPPFPATFDIGEGAILLTRACGSTESERDAVGEVPDEEPYLLRQILDAKRAVDAAAIGLVLMDAGINDTEVYNLVLPGKSTSAVIARARSIRPRISFALDAVGQAFPNARIVVTGYYPVVSLQSRLVEILQFARRVVAAAVEEGVHVADDIVRVLTHPGEPHLGVGDTTTLEALRTPDPFAPLARELATRCAGWLDATHEVLADVVADVNRSGARAAFADPQFGPAHAVFAEESLLWPFRGGEPLDPKAAWRKAYCARAGVIGFHALTVECASMGHPAPAGAARYAEAAVSAARSLGVF